MLSVAARETGSGVEAAIDVKPTYGLSDDEIARMLQDSIGSADDDMRARALREQQVEAQRLLEATLAALAADGICWSRKSATRSNASWPRVSKHLQDADAAAIRQATDALIASTDDFAARRMDRSIRAALAGRTIEETGQVACSDAGAMMPKITVLPHEELCPEGAEFDVARGVTLTDALLEHGVDIEHACGKWRRARRVTASSARAIHRCRLRATTKRICSIAPGA